MVDNMKISYQIWKDGLNSQNITLDILKMIWINTIETFSEGLAGFIWLKTSVSLQLV